jgi:selenocysteine-specific elongation factor
VTKADAVDAVTLELALEEARELVPGAAVVAVSAKTGRGLDDLRSVLARTAEAVERAGADRPTRLYVDRSFSLRGIGTVVTGTLRSGTLGAGDELRLEPTGRSVRVRSVQVHDREVERADSGQRVAVSLPGVERSEVLRGDALVEPGAYAVSYRLDLALEEIEPIRDGARVQAHIGTAHIPARVVKAGERWAQLRLAEPVVAARGDRVVLRGETTLGGGAVIDPAPPRHRDERRMALVESGDVAATIHAPAHVDSFRHLLDGDVAGVARAGDWLFSRAWLDDFEHQLRKRIEAADPLDPGIPLPAGEWAPDILPLLSFERRGARLYLPGVVASLGRREAEADALVRALAEAGVRATKAEDDELVRYLEAQGMLVRLGPEHAIGSAAYDKAREALLAECRAAGEIALARFRDLLGVGRRDAQLLLERFDQDGITRRVGDRRVLRRAAAEVTSRQSS